MRDDSWLAGRLNQSALWWESGDDPAAAAVIARERSPSFAQARVGVDEVATVAALENAGFRVVDVTVTMVGTSCGRPVTAGVEVSEATPEDLPDLLDIAENHYGVSRFHLDPLVPDGVADRIKRDWLEAYVDRTRGDCLLAARRDGRAIGFLAQISQPDRTEIIDLIAVHTAQRGAGAGAALIGELAGRRIQAGTQASNLGALRFYGRLGFEPAAAAYVLHLHS